MGSVERVPTRSAPLDRLSHRDAAVDVWQVDLDSPDGRDPRIPAGLSDDEKRRAGAFRFDQDRRRFIACRSAVRMILGRYLGSPASDPSELPEAGGIGTRSWTGYILDEGSDHVAALMVEASVVPAVATTLTMGVGHG